MLGFVTFFIFTLECTHDDDCSNGEVCVSGVCHKGMLYLDRMISQII